MIYPLPSCTVLHKSAMVIPSKNSSIIVWSLCHINNDMNNPCVVGSLWNQENTLPDGVVTVENTVKAVVMRSGSTLLFSEEEKKEKIIISTPGGMSIVLDDEEETITISGKAGKNTVIIDGQTGNVMVNAGENLSLYAKNVELTANNSIALKASKISMDASSNLTFTGSSAEVNAKVNLKLSSSGIAEIKGSMIRLNS